MLMLRSFLSCFSCLSCTSVTEVSNGYKSPMKHLRTFAILSAFVLTYLVVTNLAFAASPPFQPESGAGGSDYIATEVVKKAIGGPKNPTLVFYSSKTTQEPRSVVVFFHAWGAVNPAVYGGWIDHLARKGHVVLWPRYQDVGRTGASMASDVAMEATKQAFELLKSDADIKLDLQKIAYIGHLAGAGVALNVATRAPQIGLPTPRVIFAAMPGGLAAEAKPQEGKVKIAAPPSRGIPLVDVSALPANTLLISMIGDREHQASERTTRRVFREAKTIPIVNKVLLRIQSDDHGFPAHTANLVAPGSYLDAYDISKITLPVDPTEAKPAKKQRQPRPIKAPADANLSGEQYVLVQQMERTKIDAIDYLGFWKVFDLTFQHAFQDADASALRVDPKLVDMGSWSNGWPVKRINVEAAKESVLAPSQDNTPASTSSTKASRAKR
jgi:pimeloyl-ACP methyl ester carboxylesterase